MFRWEHAQEVMFTLAGAVFAIKLKNLAIQSSWKSGGFRSLTAATFMKTKGAVPSDLE